MLAGLTWPGISIGYFRREYPMLEGPGGAIIRSHELMDGWASWNGSDRRWTFKGSILQFCHASSESDVYKYQSQQFDIILMDEATQFTRYQYRYLLSRNRATKDGITPFMVLATNPGNEGHAWFKAEFVDIGPPEKSAMVEVEPGRFEKHIFIPAKLSDNMILEQRDPGYRATLEAMPEITRKQLLEGDWTAFSGQYFPSWRRDIHVGQTPKDFKGWLEQTKNHKKFRCLDYGLDMTACYWVDIGPGGALTVYREFYKPDLILSKAARSVVEPTTPLENISYTVASPDLWNRRQDGGVPGEETMRKAGLRDLRKADDRRVPGWEHMAEWLEPYDDPQTNKPISNIVFFDCCQNAIKQIPSLIRDDGNPNDVSDKVEDHAGEAIRYGLMSRPKPFVPDTSKLAEVEAKWGNKPDREVELIMWRKYAAEEDKQGGVTFDDLGM
ncbi:MAG: terminase family protein [bacterium]